MAAKKPTNNVFYLFDGDIYETLKELEHQLDENPDHVSDGDEVIILQEIGRKVIRTGIRIE